MVKKTYITPAFLAVELSMKNVAMLTASNGSGTSILNYGGEDNGADIGVKEITSKSVWDEEW